MRLLQRYIFFELLRLFTYLVCGLTVLLVFIGLFKEASERGLGHTQIFQLLPYVAPSMLPFTIPATLLLTVCVIYGRVAGDQEVVAAKAAGVHVMTLLNPALLLGAILSIGSFALTNHVIPWASRNIETVIAQASGTIFLDVLSSQHQINEPSLGLSITVTGVEGRTLLNPTFKKALKNEHYIVQAQDASLDFDTQNQEVLVLFRKARITRPGSRRELWMESHPQRFPLSRTKGKMQPRAMTIREIKSAIGDMEQQSRDLEDERDWIAATSLLLGDFDRLSQENFAGYRKQAKRQLNLRRKLRTEMHSRFAMAGSCFLFVLLGAAFSILQAKQQFLTNFIMCFLPILLVYYPVTFLMMNLSKSGSVEPWWAMWVANVVIGIGGLFYLRRVVRY